MKNLTRNPIFYLLLFFVINLLQAIFTAISKDEAYYWMYAKNLDWGYFDHPPMIALMVKTGGLLFGQTLGVRFMTVILSTATLWIIWKLIPQANRQSPRSVLFFFLLAFSFPIFNIYGFITTADVPLLFFSALYLLVFLRFLKSQTYTNALLLGVVAGLLMYSKYHGAFVIIFSLLANTKLLGNPKFYLAGIIGILLYLPHLMWQYNHDFISFRYHLVQRTDGFMGGKHVIEYILNAFVILNPFLFGYYLFILRKRKITEGVDRVYPVLLWGFLLFFAFTSFRDHIEPQWIGVGSIPLLVILHHVVVNASGKLTYMKPALVGSLVLIVIARVGLVLPLPVKSEFHQQKASFYELVREKAAGDRVVFINTYYDAAKYTFYTGEPAFSYNCYDYRKNQYDLWDYENLYAKEPAFFLSGYPYPWADSALQLEGLTMHTERFPAFPMVNKVAASWENPPTTIESQSIQQLRFVLRNPYSYSLVFNDPEIPLRFYAVFQVGLKRLLVLMSSNAPEEIPPFGEAVITAFYYPDLPIGTYRLAVGLQPINISPLLITEKVEVEVIDPK